MANNETIKISVKVDSNGEQVLKKVNNELEDINSEIKTATKNNDKFSESLEGSKNKVSVLNKDFQYMSKELFSIKNIADVMGKSIAILSFGELLGEIVAMGSGFEKLENKMKSLGASSAELDALKMSGISRFDTEDIQESFNLLRSQGIEFNQDMLKVISDTSLATNQNIVTVTEQFRAVMNGETASLDDYFKSVVKTSDGIVVQYTSKSGEMKTKLLKDQNDMVSALSDQYSGVTDNLNKSASEQARIYKEKFFNIMSEEIVSLTNTFGDFFSKITGYEKASVEEQDRQGDRLIRKRQAYQDIIKKFNSDPSINKESEWYQDLIRLEKELNISQEKRYINLSKGIGTKEIEKEAVATNKEVEAVLKTLDVSGTKTIEDLSKKINDFMKDKQIMNILGGDLTELKKIQDKQAEIIFKNEEKILKEKIDKIKQSIEVEKSEGFDQRLILLKQEQAERIKEAKGSTEEISAINELYNVKFQSLAKERTKTESEEAEKSREKIEKENYRKYKQLEEDSKNYEDFLKKQLEYRIRTVEVDYNKNSFQKSIEIEKLKLEENLRLVKGYGERENAERLLLTKEYNNKVIELNKSREETIKNLTRREDFLLSQEQLNNRELEDSKSMYDRKIEALQDANAKEEEINQAKFDKEMAREKILEQQQLNRLSVYADGFGAMSNLLKTFGSENKKAFEAAKLASIAEASMNMYVAASKAWAQGGTLGAIGAGIALSQGAIQISNIQAQQYPTYHTGGYISGGNSSSGLKSDEMNATLQTGEGVLSRKGMKQLEELNNGTTSNGNVEVILVSNMEEAINRQLKSRSGKAIIREIKG